MITYQDLEKLENASEEKRMAFVRKVINDHKSSKIYKDALVSRDYARQHNTTINEYRKILYTMSGQAVPDNWSANYKLASGFLGRFITQEVQFLLGNGIAWEDKNSAEKAFGDKFDIKLQDAGKRALITGEAFMFYNLDHVDVFDVLNFAPLYDEEDGTLKAGVRFWQIADNKPLRATLYELDGYTEYIWKKTKGEILHEKDSYITKFSASEVDGEEILEKHNYPSFPIVPLWGNPEHTTELDGKRDSIDAYDLIRSGFANDLDDASQIYWTIQNAGGMDDVDLVKFMEHMKIVKAAVVDDTGAKAESHTIEVPYNAREAILNRLEKDIYKDFMAFNPETIASGAVTATQIKAAYEPLNVKCDQFEYCIHEALDALMLLAGVENEASFTRSMIVNVNEEIQMLMQAAPYLEETYITEKVMTLLGDADKVDDAIKQMDANELQRFGNINEANDGEEEI